MVYFKLIKQFRNNIRLYNVKQATIVYAAFSATDDDKDNNNLNKPKDNLSFRGNNLKLIYLYEIKYYQGEYQYLDYYLGFNYLKKLGNQKPKDNIIKKIKNKLNKEPELKKKVENAIEKAKARQKNNKKMDNNKNKDKDK